MLSESIVGQPPADWRVLSLGELCDEHDGSVQTGPFGSQLHKSDYVEQGIPSIMPQDIKTDRVSIAKVAFITEADAERLSKYRVQPGDIVYSRRGDVERRALITQREAGWLCGTGCLRVRPAHPGVDGQYLYLYLGHPLVRAWVVRHAQGATMPNLNTSILRSLPLTLPPLPEQRRIAAVLGALDDKIELNRKMNQTLEEMAQALFKSWFIDFDGHDPADLVDSELGPIPRGWGVGCLIDHLTLQRGFDLPKKKRVAGAYTVFAAGGPHGKHNEHKVEGPGVVTGRSGKLGDVYLSEEPFWPLNTTLWVKKYGRSKPYHAYHLLQSLDLSRFNSGSAVPSLNRNHVHNLPIPLPPQSKVDEFEDKVRSLFGRRRQNRMESRTLADLRDALLPKLISGEIRVPEAEAAVGAAL